MGAWSSAAAPRKARCYRLGDTLPHHGTSTQIKRHVGVGFRTVEEWENVTADYIVYPATEKWCMALVGNVSSFDEKVLFLFAHDGLINSDDTGCIKYTSQATYYIHRADKKGIVRLGSYNYGTKQNTFDVTDAELVQQCMQVMNVYFPSRDMEPVIIPDLCYWGFVKNDLAIMLAREEKSPGEVNFQQKGSQGSDDSEDETASGVLYLVSTDEELRYNNDDIQLEDILVPI